MSRVASQCLGFGLCVAPFVGALGYEVLEMALPFREERVRTSRGDEFVLRVKRRPPPTGLVAYPASRVLLEWCLLDEDESDSVLEIGSGTGLFAIGAKRASKTTRFLRATDACERSLENLRRNAERNGVGGDSLEIEALKIGATTSLAVAPKTMIVGADLVYAAGGMDAKDLARALARALKSDVSCRLVLVDRWSGGTHAALGGLAGVSVTSATTDPAIATFERYLRDEGLELVDMDPGQRDLLKTRLWETLDLSHRLAWSLLGTFDQMRCCEVVVKRKKGV